MKDQDIDKLFREGLEDHQVLPSAGLWDKISEQLDEHGKNKIVGMGSARKKAARTWVKYVAAACVVIGIGLFVYVYQPDHSPLATSDFIASRQNEADQASGHSGKLLSTSSAEMEISEKATANITPNAGDQLITQVQQPADLHNRNSESGKANGSYTKAKHPHTADLEVNDKKLIAPAFAANTEEAVAAEAIEMPRVLHLQLAEVPPVELPTRYVTEVEPIKPIVEPFEEGEDMMIAGTVRKATNNVINKIIHVVSDSTPAQVGKDVLVSKDEEGSFRLELGTLFAKNRIKKRK